MNLFSFVPHTPDGELMFKQFNGQWLIVNRSELYSLTQEYGPQAEIIYKANQKSTALIGAMGVPDTIWLGLWDGQMYALDVPFVETLKDKLVTRAVSLVLQSLINTSDEHIGEALYTLGRSLWGEPDPVL